MSSQPNPPEDPAPKPATPNDAASFGAGAFEGDATATPREVELERAAPLEASTPPSVIELGPSTPSEPVASIASAPEPLLSTTPASSAIRPPPAPATSPAEPPAPPRVVLHEVEAVPVGRFDAPAPTIDVQARRQSPPPAAEPPRARAPGEPAPVPPIAAAMPPPHSQASDASAEAARASSAPSSSAGATSAAPRASDATSRWWSAFCHLFLFLDLVTFFLGSVITLLVWQLAGKNDPLLDDQGREALNFQLNVAIVSALLVVSCLGAPLVIVVWLLATVLCLLGAIRAANGERFRYPLIVRLVRA